MALPIVGLLDEGLDGDIVEETPGLFWRAKAMVSPITIHDNIYRL